jgi:hypothetical protein
VCDVLRDSRSPSDIDQLLSQSNQFFFWLQLPRSARPVGSSHNFLPLSTPILLGAPFPPRFKIWPSRSLLSICLVPFFPASI